MKSLCSLFLVAFQIIACSLFSFEILPQSAATDGLGYDNCDSTKNGEHLILQTFIKPNFIVFDVGANIGNWTEAVLKLYPTSFVHAFEPVPASFQTLFKRFPSRQVSAHNLAMSNELGKATFYNYYGSQSATELSGFYNREVLKNNFKTPREIQVDQETLDAFCKRCAINQIDFLKVDTEGAEWKVLLGAQSLLQNQKIKVLQFEYGGCYIDAKTSLQQVARLLTNYGYVLFRIVPQGLIHIAHWTSSLECMRYSNYIAIPEKDASKYKKIDNL